MISKIILNTFFLFSVLTTFSQTDTGKKMHTKLIKVSNKVYMLQGKGGNIGLSFGNEGIFMIDDQYADGIEQIQEDIKAVSDKPIKFLVNTHFHGDHTGGNQALAENGTVIFSQDNVRTRLKEVLQNATTKITEKSLPVVTFTEDLSFYFNSEKIFIFHVHEAHTDGDAMVYFTRSNVLHTGDVFFNGKYPYIDTEHGGSLKGVIAALTKALTVINEDTKIIPGHGDIGTPKDLQNTINMLETVYKRMSTKFVSRKTEAEILASTELTEEYDEQGFGEGFINTEAFLKMVYSEISKERNHYNDLDEKNKAAREKVEEMIRKSKEKKE